MNTVLFRCSKQGVWGRRQAPEGNSEVKWSKRTYRGGRPPRSELVGETDRRGHKRSESATRRASMLTKGI